jgi:alkaline phosphatase D
VPGVAATLEAGHVDNVVLTGDIHSFGTHDLKLDYADAASPVIGAELVGGSITSGGQGQRGTNEAVTAALAATNPHTRYVEYEHRGYGVCDVTPDRWTTSYRMLTDVRDPSSPIETPARFVVDRGHPGIRRDG